MNPGGIPSSLEKIQALKTEQENLKQEEENLKKQKKQDEEKSVQEEYEKEKAELEDIQNKRDEIFSSLSEVRGERGRIISSGRQVVNEAKNADNDGALYNKLKTKDVFSDVFSTEKNEWKSLQEKVITLSTEKEKNQEALSKKEKTVEELFTKTKEGIRVAEEKEKEAILNKYLPSEGNLSHYFGLSALQNGKWDLNIIEKKEEILMLPKEEQEKVLAIIKNELHSKVANMYEVKNKGNLEAIGQDVERVEKYEAERGEAYKMFSEFRENKLHEYNERYNRVFVDKDSEIYQRIMRYYGESGQKLITHISTLGFESGSKNLLSINKELGERVNDNGPVVDLVSVREYLEGVQKANDGLLEIIEGRDIEKINEIFSSKNNSVGWEENFGVENSYSLSRKLGGKISLIKNPVSLALKLSPSELKKYFEEKMQKQEVEKNDINDFVDAGVDQNMIYMQSREMNTYPEEIAREIKNTENRKENADWALQTVRNSMGRFDGQMSEKIYFKIPSVGITLNVPKLGKEFEEIGDYTGKIGVKDLDILEEKIKLTQLKNKKLGFLDSKAKHAEAINKMEELIKKNEDERINFLNNRKYLINQDNSSMKILFDKLSKVEGFSAQKDADVTDGMYIEEMLKRLEEKLTEISSEKYPSEKIEIYEKFSDANKRLEKARVKIFEGQKAS